MSHTIFALSSGAPPAAIAVIRISGPHAGDALRALAGRLPEERRATAMVLRDAAGEALDRALVLWLPGPGSATGEDMAELHCHGGRAVVAAVEASLARLPELRRATSGEFTRRAFANGRIDLAEAEGLADLLSAETELQRRGALAMAGGAFSQRVEDWRERLLEASAALEAVLDFADEDDVALLPGHFAGRLEALREDIGTWLIRPRAEVLREGFQVVLAGPPNAGKSTLFNSLVESEAAIATPIAGTTRDVLTRPVAIEGVPFLFADTAGLRDETGDTIEAIGVERAPRHRVSARTGEGMAALRSDLVAAARAALPKPGQAALNLRQHRLLTEAETVIGCAATLADPLLAAENLRLARVAFDALLGRTATEDMLDALFGRFCIGK